MHFSVNLSSVRPWNTPPSAISSCHQRLKSKAVTYRQMEQLPLIVRSEVDQMWI